MTDRIRHLTVVLDADYRDDDVEPSIVEAVRMIRGVAHVEEHVIEVQDQLARMAVCAEIERELHKAIDDVFARKSSERKDRT